MTAREALRAAEAQDLAGGRIGDDGLDLAGAGHAGGSGGGDVSYCFDPRGRPRRERLARGAAGCGVERSRGNAVARIRRRVCEWGRRRCVEICGADGDHDDVAVFSGVVDGAGFDVTAGDIEQRIGARVSRRVLVARVRGIIRKPISIGRRGEGVVERRLVGDFGGLLRCPVARDRDLQSREDRSSFFSR
nr:hypothetical protein [Cumulibacter soli]